MPQTLRTFNQAVAPTPACTLNLFIVKMLALLTLGVCGGAELTLGGEKCQQTPLFHYVCICNGLCVCVCAHECSSISRLSISKRYAVDQKIWAIEYSCEYKREKIHLPHLHFVRAETALSLLCRRRYCFCRILLLLLLILLLLLL